MPADILQPSLTPDGEVDGRDWTSSEPPRSLPFQPCTLTVHGLPRVVDKLLWRLGFDHAQIVHVTDTTIVATAWDDATEGEITLRTFQAPVLVAADDPSVAIDHGAVLELRRLTTTTSVELPTLEGEFAHAEGTPMYELPCLPTCDESIGKKRLI